MSLAYVDQFEAAALKAPATGPTGAEPKTQPVADAAHTLVAQFGQPESTQSRTRSIWDMARVLTVAEFSSAMDAALKQAAANDKATGWVPPAGAKGRAKYGPSQSTLATVASQCRQVFGACKIDAECIITAAASGVVHADLFPNWSTAVTKARAFLDDKGIDWQGQSVSATEAARDYKAQANAATAARVKAIKEHPQQPGETQADYEARMAAAGADNAEESAQSALHDKAQKELKRLIKVHGDNVGDILEMMVHAYNAMQEPAPV